MLARTEIIPCDSIPTQPLTHIHSYTEITTFRPCALIDEFVVIATDGLWDVMSSQEVVTHIKRYVSYALTHYVISL